MIDLSGIRSVLWFGGSWLLGTELEKEYGTTQVDPIVRDRFVEDSRFTGLVSRYFGWEEINLAQEGISPERLMLEIIDRVDKLSSEDIENCLLIILWPSFQRYFWIDDTGSMIDVRAVPEYSRWYREVDNYPFQMYTAQRTIWALDCFLRQRRIKYTMMNCEYRVTEPWYLDFPKDNWAIPPEQRISDVLEVDLDHGYPGEKEKHKYFWPCRAHPNIYGHKRIADKIINYLSREKQS